MQQRQHTHTHLQSHDELNTLLTFRTSLHPRFEVMPHAILKAFQQAGGRAEASSSCQKSTNTFIPHVVPGHQFLFQVEIKAIKVLSFLGKWSAKEAARLKLQGVHNKIRYRK